MISKYSGNNQMKQIGNKNVGFRIEIMAWSDKMDLIALANDKGEVIIHRLKLQKVWTHPPPKDGLNVRGIAWRPLEKVIALAYSNGQILLLNIENKDEIHSFNIQSDITCMNWTQNTKEIPLSDTSNDVINSHTVYLATLPNLSSLSSTAKTNDYNALKFYSKQILNLLVVGTTNGFVHLSVFGMLSCGQIDIFKKLSLESCYGTIKDAKMSSNFKQLFVIIEGSESLELFVLENSILQKYSTSLLNLAIKHAHILNTMAYITDTIECIVEAWETVLLEMDNKLTKYGNSQPHGSISADFLELLMFGYTSDALEQFLLRDLTEKGLKKLGNSIELSYSTIQKLVVKPLHTAILNVYYHLNALQGMIRNSYYYKPLLGEVSCEALTNCGAFLIKAYELQQTIDTSTRDYKIFFRWLYVVIIRLMEETIPDDNANVTQQEINYLAEFLNNFDMNSEDDVSILGETKQKFNLERVGQYLEDKPLIFPPKYDATNQWSKLLEQNDCLKSCPSIFPHHKDLSLIQQHNLLKNSIEQIFEKPKTVIGDDFKLKGVVWNKYQGAQTMNKADETFCTHINLEKENVALFAILESEKSFLFIEIQGDSSIKSLIIEFRTKPFFEKFVQLGDVNLKFKHVQFYNEEILSLLLQNRNADNRNASVFIQFPVRVVRDLLSESSSTTTSNSIIDIRAASKSVNAYSVIQESWINVLDGIDGCTIAVSGFRSVASVLSESRKTIRLYDMEPTDVGEDDEDQNSSFENSKESVNSA